MEAAIIDISPPIANTLKVWPGDTPPTREVLLDLHRGDNITLSTLHTTVHAGAHADAPSHYDRDGRTMESQALEPYVGPCTVCHVDASPGTRISRSDLPDQLDTPRILIATNSYPDPNAFNQDFAALEPDLVRALAGDGVKLIGIDTPSVDLFDSKDLPAHAAFAATDLAILEGLVLSSVPAGKYELIALPLRLVGFDASPVRAILRSPAGV
ncbi:MAG: cyclase family protein [Phycisphaerae bacterium]